MKLRTLLRTMISTTILLAFALVCYSETPAKNVKAQARAAGQNHFAAKAGNSVQARAYSHRREARPRAATTSSRAARPLGTSVKALNPTTIKSGLRALSKSTTGGGPVRGQVRNTVLGGQRALPLGVFFYSGQIG